MSKIALLPGFAVGLTSSLRPSLGPTAGFRAFASLIQSGEAAVFPWRIERRVPPWILLNPFFLRAHYRAELALAGAATTHRRLADFLAKEKPAVVVCHSMGCFLLNEYLKENSLPSSVKNIVMVQSDLPVTAKANGRAPAVYNLYCPWDPTLLISLMNSEVLRAGQTSWRQPHVRNILFPLRRPFNLHTSSIRDPKLVAFVRSCFASEKTV
jgi:hypothetical protein